MLKPRAGTNPPQPVRGARFGDDTQTVSTSQIVSNTALAGVAPAAELDGVSESFFADGWRQETSGLYVESPPRYRGSLDRIPRHNRARLLFVFGVFGVVVGVAWWLGWRPPATWQLSSLWRAARDLVGR